MKRIHYQGKVTRVEIQKPSSGSLSSSTEERAKGEESKLSGSRKGAAPPDKLWLPLEHWEDKLWPHDESFQDAVN